MEKELQQVLKNGLRLYYRILKLHRRVLPAKMRSIGDIYVRQEFKHHHENPQLQFYGQFYSKWEAYELELGKKGVKQAAKNMTEREEQLLTKDQREALKILKEGIATKL